MSDRYLFSIKLAGIPIGVSSLFSTTPTFCRDYFTDDMPSFRIETNPEDIISELEKSAREAEAEGIPFHRFSDEYLETLAVYRKIAEAMPTYDTILFHGSAIMVDGAGYLFIAKSGTGKSTHTRLWRKLFGDRSVMVNDDKPLVQVTQQGACVCGTPWDGRHRLSNNLSAPLKGICILERGTENEISPVSFREGYPMLLQQSYRPADPNALCKTLSLLECLGQQVPLYRLRCNMEPEAAQIAYSGMNERKQL